MTIHNDQSRDLGGAGDLLGRVRRAHGRELDGSESLEDAERTRPPLSDGLRAAERRVVSETDGELKRRMVETAGEVVAGHHESADGVREAIVDTVVDANYDELVAGDGREAIVAAVKETLTRDATFRAEVENMLIHAARRLGRAQRAQWRESPETDPGDGPR